MTSASSPNSCLVTSSIVFSGVGLLAINAPSSLRRTMLDHQGIQ